MYIYRLFGGCRVGKFLLYFFIDWFDVTVKVLNSYVLITEYGEEKELWV